MPRRSLALPLARPWHVTVRRLSGEPLLESSCETAGAAAALAAVLTTFWPVVASCRRPGSDNALISQNAA